MNCEANTSSLVIGVPTKTRYSPFGETDSVMLDIKKIPFAVEDDDVGNTICLFFQYFLILHNEFLLLRYFYLVYLHC